MHDRVDWLHVLFATGAGIVVGYLLRGMLWWFKNKNL